MPAVKVLSRHTLKYISGDKTDHFWSDTSENIGSANKNLKKKKKNLLLSHTIKKSKAM